MENHKTNNEFSLKRLQELLFETAEEAEEQRVLLKSQRKTISNEINRMLAKLLHVRDCVESLQTKHSVSSWDFFLDSIDNMISTLSKIIFSNRTDLILIDILYECHFISEKASNLSLGKLLALEADFNENSWSFHGPLMSIVDENSTLGEEYEVIIKEFIDEGKLPLCFFENLQNFLHDIRNEELSS